MADPLSISHNQFTTLLNVLTTIDQRLHRIEGALRLAGGVNGAPLTPAGAAAAAAAIVSVPLPPPPPNASMVLNAGGGGSATVLGPGGSGGPGQSGTGPIPGPGPAPMPVSVPLPVSVSVPVPMAVAAVRALEPPPEGFTISSRNTMQEELDQWTIPRGYSMHIAGAKVTGKRKVRWVCFRGGEARHHRAPVDESVILQAKAEGRRKPTTDRTSKKCGCLFKFEVIETAKGSDVWVLHYPNDEHKVHNHGPSDQTSDPRARKLPALMLVEVDRWLRDGWPVSKIQDELKARNFTNVLNTDLYNRKRLLKKEDSQLHEE